MDRIDNPEALLFVLERAGNNPVDITNLSVEDSDDIRFEAVAAHMHHIRILGLCVRQRGTNFTTPSCAHTAFTTAAPLLRILSFSPHRDARANRRCLVHSMFKIPENTWPRLSYLELHGVEMTSNLCSRVQTLRAFSFNLLEPSRFGTSSLDKCPSQYLRHITTINIELAGWNASQGYPELGPSVTQVNIRWTRPGLFVPQDAVPSQAVWTLIRAIHVSHMSMSSDTLLDAATTTPTFVTIPQTGAPYDTLSLRTSGAPDKCVHVRAFDREDRERVFCGLHPATVVGMLARIPGEALASITIATTVIALRVLSEARLPVLSCIRLVLDTDDIAWIDGFTRDMPTINTLERLEFSQEADPAAHKWTTAIIIHAISCCIAAGNKLHEVLFLGFSPDSQCLAVAHMFSQQVVVDQNWRELKNERTWFREPPFEWL